jgi:hypothetical protein
VSYKTTQQTCVAQSICEAQYYFASNATKEGLHLCKLTGHILNEPISGTTILWEDNQSAIAYSLTALVIEKTKHIGLK